MAYKVLQFFTDLQDNNFPYSVGDTFPRAGKNVSADRITELSGTQNLRGIALIEEVRGAEETAQAVVSTTTTVEPDNAVSVENEPRKRGRKRKTGE